MFEPADESDIPAIVALVNAAFRGTGGERSWNHEDFIVGPRTARLSVVNAPETPIGWHERRGYRPTGETMPFPHGDSRFGRPLRDDLAFVMLEKRL